MMKKLFLAACLWLGLTAPAQALTNRIGYVDGLAFVAQTRIHGPDDGLLALCHTTVDLQVLGLALTQKATGFALSSDQCRATIDRLMNADQFMTAQSLGLVAADIAPLSDFDWQRTLRSHGFWAALALALLALMIRQIRVLLARRPSRLRKTAAMRILSAMCYAGKSAGRIGDREVALIAATAAQLTGWIFAPADISGLIAQIDLALRAQDYIAFGEGLRDREKDVMMRASCAITVARGWILPGEYHFLAALAGGLGMAGDDVRRAFDLAMADYENLSTT